VPTPINLPSFVKVTDISAGEEHCSLISNKGDVYTWGYGIDGQLGHGNKVNLDQPKRLDLHDKFSHVDCGGGHTGLITDNHTLYMTGRGRDG
jgi:alpha-tubulin suppressor-like RCC1 family protein